MSNPRIRSEAVRPRLVLLIPSFTGVSVFFYYFGVRLTLGVMRSKTLKMLIGPLGG